MGHGAGAGDVDDAGPLVPVKGEGEGVRGAALGAREGGERREASNLPRQRRGERLLLDIGEDGAVDHALSIDRARKVVLGCGPINLR